MYKYILPLIITATAVSASGLEVTELEKSLRPPMLRNVTTEHVLEISRLLSTAESRIKQNISQCSKSSETEELIIGLPPLLKRTVSLQKYPNVHMNIKRSYGYPFIPSVSLLAYRAK